MPASKNKALVVGISKYRKPIKPLPAVARDVRAIANVLSSRKGIFSRDFTAVLTESHATTKAIVAAAKSAFAASATETVFAYLAGHGQVEGADYYFISHDTDIRDIANTAVPLRTIKALFDKCKSKRVFLWLDCCHSGGILTPRSTAAATSAGTAAIRRALEVVRGEGRVIIAACTADQLAYEDPSLGHGVFTHALLRGLKGEAASRGEVTASSLYDFIDREIGGERQSPMFFGQTTGRIVLMHGGASQSRIAQRTSSQQTPSQSPNRPSPKSVASSGKWVMLGDQMFLSKNVRRKADGLIEVEVLSRTASDDAALQRLKPANHHGRRELPFAHGNDADDVIIQSLTSESARSGQIWTIALRPGTSQSGGSFGEVTYSEGRTQITPDDVARMRARFILYNEPPIRKSSSRSPFPGMWEHAVVEANGIKITPPVPATYLKYKGLGDWRQIARLQSIYLLKSTNTVEHIEHLEFGPISKRAVKISFRGTRRQRYSNEPPASLECEGSCLLQSASAKVVTD